LDESEGGGGRRNSEANWYRDARDDAGSEAVEMFLQSREHLQYLREYVACAGSFAAAVNLDAL